MDKRVETLAAFVKLVQEIGRVILNKIITMDEEEHCLHTLWRPNGRSGLRGEQLVL
jgi:hypothetical protein